MSIMTAVSAHLLGHAGLSALVADRVYVKEMPPSTSATPNTMPLITFRLLDEPLMTTHDNRELYSARIRVDAWGGSAKSAHAVADQVHASLRGYRGAMGDGSVHVGGCFRKAKRDNSNDEVSLYSVEQTYVLNYKE